MNESPETQFYLNFPFLTEMCDFEVGFCDFTQDKDDDFDWTINTGGTGTFGTGPVADHTTEYSKGGHASLQTRPFIRGILDT